MKHYPGNTNNSWTRQFFGDLAHGVDRFDLFKFEPSTSGYTCDYVDGDGGAYPTVRAALNQLGGFEDIVVAGAAQPTGAAVAVLYSESSDIWMAMEGTYGSSLRSTYIALKHAGMPVDILIEDDCTAGRLHYYDVLYITLPHISDAAAAGVAAWVATGGTVYVTGGAGMLNHANATNNAMLKLLGIEPGVTQYVGTQDSFNASIRLIKQDIQFVQLLDNVSISTNISTGNGGGVEDGNATLVVKGVKTIFKLASSATFSDEYAGVDAAPAPEVLATFGSNGSPALVKTAVGKGVVYFAAFMPGVLLVPFYQQTLPSNQW
jgi:hypothetical protein